MQHFDGDIERLTRQGILDMDTGLVYATNSGTLQPELPDLATSVPVTPLETSVT
jgi:hypothetical protein